MKKIFAAAIIASSLLSIGTAANALPFRTHGADPAARCAMYKQQYTNEMRTAKVKTRLGDRVAGWVAGANAQATKAEAAKRCIVW